MRPPGDRAHARPSDGGGRDAWSAVGALVVCVALEVLDPPLLATAVGAPLLAAWLPARTPRALRAVTDAAAAASPLRPLVRRILG